MKTSKIVKDAREGALNNFEKFKSYTNTDIGYIMVQFCSKTLKTRKVNDWGRDEDDDIYIGIDKDGWLQYEHTIEYLAGPPKIKNSKVFRLDDNNIIKYLESDECTETEYLHFMSKALKCIEGA